MEGEYTRLSIHILNRQNLYTHTHSRVLILLRYVRYLQRLPH